MSDRSGTTRLLLVEGVPGLGKSTIVDGVVRRYVDATPREALRTVVALAQTHTYGPLAAREDDGSLTRDDDLAHLETIVRGIEWLIDAARSQARTKCVNVVDTLHLTHCLRPGVVTWGDVSGIDQRLAAIGGRLLLLDAGDDTIRQRTVVARAGTEFIRGYALGRFGQDEDELAAHFSRERDRFREMFAVSAMPGLIVTAETDSVEVIDKAVAFWLEPLNTIR
jgi:hypothetical protein